MACGLIMFGLMLCSTFVVDCFCFLGLILFGEPYERQLLSDFVRISGFFAC